MEGNAKIPGRTWNRFCHRCAEFIICARRKLKKLKNDVFNALHEIEADAELAVVEAKTKP